MNSSHLLAIGVLGAALSGCAFQPYQPGFLYSGLSGPVAVTAAAACTKKGVSDSWNVLGLVGVGDASIEKAKRDGGITTVASVDFDYTSILGIYGKTTTTVCGN